jgi:hypothetical protein
MRTSGVAADRLQQCTSALSFVRHAVNELASSDAPFHDQRIAGSGAAAQGTKALPTTNLKQHGSSLLTKP